MQNIIEKSKLMIGKINPRYDMQIKEIDEICKNSENPIDMIYDGFRFGYLQGMKAAKAEMKKGGVVNV